MARLADVRRMFEYNRVVLGRYRRALKRLPWRTVTRNRETGHHSMRNTYLHILRVHNIWLNYVVQDRLDAFPAKGLEYSDFPSWREILSFDRKVWSGISRFLASLSESDLRRKVRAPWMPGEYTLEDAFYQTTFEQAHHLGELIAMFWQLDKKPPEMTWIDTTRAMARRSR
jgi:uncharacterized damage-inducible protein DinB